MKTLTDENESQKYRYKHIQCCGCVTYKDYPQPQEELDEVEKTIQLSKEERQERIKILESLIRDSWWREEPRKPGFFEWVWCNIQLWWLTCSK